MYISQYLKYLSIIIPTVLTTVWAQGSPQFSFEGATAAFAAGHVPTPQELTSTKWMLIGLAFSPASPDSGTSAESYWPDGKLTIPGESGYFKRIDTFTLQTDAFGSKNIVWNDEVIGNETGKIYSNYGPEALTATSTGYRYQGSISGTDQRCSESFECRITSGEMLLCAHSIMDTHPSCDQYPQNVVSSFAGYLPLK